MKRKFSFKGLLTVLWFISYGMAIIAIFNEWHPWDAVFVSITLSPAVAVLVILGFGAIFPMEQK